MKLIERVVVDECVGQASALLEQVRCRLGDRPIEFVFLSTHPGIPDIEILDKLLDVRSALLTQDRVLHNLAISRGFRSFVHTPESGLTDRAYRSRKFGSWEYSQKLDAQVTAAAAQAGLTMRHDLMKRTPNTFNAHRLIWLAERGGVQDAVVEGLFRAYFVEGRDVGDKGVLVDLAAAGIDGARASVFLAGTEGADEVAEAEAASKRGGMNGHPDIRHQRTPGLLRSAARRADARAYAGRRRPVMIGDSPLKVTVAGGSIGGLCAGIALRGIGADVEIFERDPGPMNTRGAGIVVQPQLTSLLREHNAPALPVTSCRVRRYLDPSGGDGQTQAMPQAFTSWEAIYLALRATFPDDRYHMGAAVTDITPEAGRVVAAVTGRQRLEWHPDRSRRGELTLAPPLPP